MKLTETEIEILIKYLPEDKINDILNFQKIIDYVCEKFNLTEDQLSSSARSGVLPYVRMILVALSIKIFDPYKFEDNVFKPFKSKISNGISGMISIAVKKSYTMPRYYLTKLREYLETKQLDIKILETMEREILNRFEYK